MTLMQVKIDVDELSKTIADATERLEIVGRDAIPESRSDRQAFMERVGRTLKDLDFAQRELTSASLLGEVA